MERINKKKLDGNLLIFLCLILLILHNCDYVDRRLVITNQSKKAIYYFYQCENNLKASRNDNGYLSDVYRVEPDSFKNVRTVGVKDGWIKNVNSCPDSTLKIFIFYEDTLKKYEMKDIIRGKRYAKKYILNKKQLDSINWEVTFP